MIYRDSPVLPDITENDQNKINRSVIESLRQLWTISGYNNKIDSEPTIASLRTLGNSYTQAARGDHTHSLSSLYGLIPSGSVGWLYSDGTNISWSYPISGLTANRVVLAASATTVKDNANLTFISNVLNLNSSSIVRVNQDVSYYCDFYTSSNTTYLYGYGAAQKITITTGGDVEVSTWSGGKITITEYSGNNIVVDTTGIKTNKTTGTEVRCVLSSTAGYIYNSANLKYVSGNLILGAGYVDSKTYYYINGGKIIDIDGTENLHFGPNCGTGDSGYNNYASGSYSLAHNTGGGYNLMALGRYALHNNIDGFNNVAIGSQSLFLNQNGYWCIAIGANSLIQNNSNYNIGIGGNTLYNNQYGLYNIAIGVNSCISILGNANVGIGQNTLYYAAGTSAYNVAIGMSAGFNGAEFSGCVYIGYKAGYNETASNRLYITNSDTTSTTSLIYGEFNTPLLRTCGDFDIVTGKGITINSLAPSGQYIRGNGTRGVYSAIQWGDLPGISGLTDHYIPYFHGSTSTFIDSPIYTDGSIIGIGTTTLIDGLDIARGGATTTTGLTITNYSASAGYQPVLRMRQSNSNTKGTLTATVNNQYLGTMSFQGVDSSNSAFREAAVINIKQDGAAGANYVPSKIEFSLTRASDGVSLTPLTIDNTGIVTTTKDGLSIKVTPVTSTTYTYIQVKNGSGNFFFGVEGSAVGSLATGDTAYAGVIATIVDKPIEIAPNQVVKFSVSSTLITALEDIRNSYKYVAYQDANFYSEYYTSSDITYIKCNYAAQKLDISSGNDLSLSTWSSGAIIITEYGGNNIELNSTQIEVDGVTLVGDITTNYTKFESTGFQEFTGSARQYNDLQFPTSVGKLPGANAPTWEALTTNTSEYSFTVNDYIDLQASELIHSWDEGTKLDFHVHMTIKTLQNSGANRYAKFTLYVSYADADNSVWTEAGAISGEKTIPNGAAALTNYYLDIGDITLTGYHIGGQVKVRVKRVAATGGTEYTGNVFVTQVGAHILCDTIGSRSESSK